MNKSKLLIYPLLFTLLLSESFASCELTSFLPDLDGSACQDTAQLSRPFLEEEAKQREADINQELGSLLTKFAALKLKEIGDIDTSTSLFGQGLQGAGSKCSLQAMLDNPPCDINQMNKNISNISNGSMPDLDSLLNEISQQYESENTLSVSSSGDNCMSDAYRREYKISEFLKKYKDFDLKEFYSSFVTDNSIQGIDEDGFLADFTLLFWNDFSGDINQLDFSKIEGSNLEEQLESLFSNATNQTFLNDKAQESCSKMFSTIETFLCTDIGEYVVNDSDFNENINHPVDLVANGFDSFSIEMEGVDLENTYRGFILNCPSDSYDIDSDNTIDSVIQSLGISVKKLYGDVAASKDRSLQQSFIREEKVKSICSLLACDNFTQVDEGEECSEREQIRSIDELNEDLNCPEDDMCASEDYQALIRTLTRTRSRVASPSRTIIKEDGTEEVIPAQTGLSSFGTQFITNSRREAILASHSSAPVVANAPAEVVAQENVAVEDTQTRVSLADSIPSSADDSSSGSRDIRSRDTNATYGRGRDTADSSSPAPTREEYLAQNSRAIQGDQTAFVGEAVSPSGYNSNALSTAYRSQNLAKEKEERLEAMQTQRETMEEMLGMMKDTAGIQKSLAQRNASDRVNLPSIAEANTYQDNIYNASVTNSTQRSNEEMNNEFLENARRIRDQQRAAALQVNDGPVVENFIESNSIPNSVAPTSGGIASVSTGNAGSVSASSTGASGSGISGGDMGGGAAAPSAQAATTRVTDINSLLDELGQNSQDAKLETTVNDIVQMTPSSLKDSGIEIDNPFVIVVKDNGGEFTVPVRPSLFRGRTILTPIITDATSSLTKYLRRSPLFESYYRFQDQM